jgi:8-oxo-dGTP pyrophosphatase MutT (NUDIX family)
MVIDAAGGLVWRLSSKGALKVLLVHRPRYDDWSLPKGKLDPGETFLEAAVREVAEETGFECQPDVELPEIRYDDHKGRPKRVRYWLMEPTGGEFSPNSEVDEIQWARLDGGATEELTYEHDVGVLVAGAAILVDRHPDALDLAAVGTR